MSDPCVGCAFYSNTLRFGECFASYHSMELARSRGDCAALTSRVAHRTDLEELKETVAQLSDQVAELKDRADRGDKLDGTIDAGFWSVCNALADAGAHCLKRIEKLEHRADGAALSIEYLTKNADVAPQPKPPICKTTEVTEEYDDRTVTWVSKEGGRPLRWSADQVCDAPQPKPPAAQASTEDQYKCKDPLTDADKEKFARYAKAAFGKPPAVMVTVERDGKRVYLAEKRGVFASTSAPGMEFHHVEYSLVLAPEQWAARVGAAVEHEVKKALTNTE